MITYRRPAVQEVAVAHEGLLQAMVGVLQRAAGDDGSDDGAGGWSCHVEAVCRLLHLLVKGTGSMQLAVAQCPGMLAALLQLLGAAQSEVANDAAQLLSLLQLGNEEVAAVVKEASRGVSLALV